MITVKTSCSMGKVALNHNRFEQSRKEHPSVDPTLTQDNVVLIDEIGAKKIGRASCRERV